MIAALYTERGGVYSGLPDVDAWDEARDARLYAGPWPVVAHPPCARWCRLAGLVEARWGHKRGDDGGCFAAALASVRRWGGVLEHPAYSDAWTAFDLPTPPTGGRWVEVLDAWVRGEDIDSWDFGGAELLPTRITRRFAGVAEFTNADAMRECGGSEPATAKALARLAAAGRLRKLGIGRWSMRGVWR